MRRSDLADLDSLTPELGIHATAGIRDDPSWVPAGVFCSEREWKTAIAPQYAAGLGSRSLPVGASCALQGHAGRVAGLVIGLWATTRQCLRVDPDQLWIRLEAGRSTGIAVDRAAVSRPGTAAGLARQMAGYLEPVVAASRSAGRITARLAWGDAGAGCAGWWRRLHSRTTGPARRAAIATAAGEFFAPGCWPSSPAIKIDAHTDDLRYRRGTCCLMHLAPGKRRCPGCSHLDDAEYLSRWEEAR
ncbi:MAG: hypothetical protein LKI24_02580 [Acidipropionibacterium sp.]|jgi:hypothetical protein|nr:hypothetical protein [Acidipropionibacterium sp.]